MLVVMSIVISLGVGVALALLATKLDWHNYNGQPYRINAIEFSTVAVFVTVVAVLVMVVFGPSAAKAHAAAGYKEFWNGSVVRAWSQETPCSRDGPCVHEYNCDPYQVKVVDQAAYTDKDGHYHSEVSHYETRYHDCPYATVEVSYYLDDNIGRTLTVGDHWLVNPPHAYRGGEGIPGDIPRGVPERWQTSEQRLERGDAEPVTKVNHYTNFILPSEGHLYHEYNDEAEKYLKQGLMPKHTADLDGQVLFDLDTQARKVQFVGVAPSNVEQWQDRLMRFNAALGAERQGDLHVVVVPAARITSPDKYINALVAYWQNALGKWGFPKNGVALAIGVSDDAQTIEWSRAKTGMPEGNGSMLAALKFELADKPLDPNVLLGQITAAPYLKEGGKAAVRYTHGEGLLDQIMFRDYPFKRACMRHCNDPGDSGTGYVFLRDSIPVSTGAKVLWCFIVFVIAAMAWGAVLFLDPIGYIKAEQPDQTQYPYPRNRRF